MNNVDCSGSESSLKNCIFPEWGEHYCSHDEDAGVICSGHTQAQLVNGSDSCSGRVELQYLSEWGAVCDVSWDMRAASVLCGQLKCESAVTVLGSDWFGEGSGRIWADVFDCQGNEKHLSNCPISSWSRTACSHKQDAGVICSGSSLAFHEGRVRLFGGMECEGEVEVYFTQDWRRVLLDSWSESEASVVWRQLGCGSVFNFSSPEHRHMCMTGFSCSGSEAHLGNCSSAQAVNCSSREQLSITCSDHLPLRLKGGERSCSGRLEVYHTAKWGSVCDNHWDIRDAQVVCRQLGCGPALSADGSAVFGAGEGPIWLNRVKCRGNEIHLWDCPHSLKNYTDCSHRQDAGVTCSGIDISVPSTTVAIFTTTTSTTTVGQPAERTSTPSPAVLAAVPSIYPVSLLVLGLLLFLALVLLVVLFYQNRVLRRVLSKRRRKTLTEAVYEEIDRRYNTKRNDSTQRGSIISEEQHSGYEDVDEELLSEKSLTGIKAEYYDDVTTRGLLSESAKEDTAESYDDVITAGQISDSVSEDIAENYDDVITADQSSAVVTDMTDNYDDAVTAGPNSNVMTMDTPENYDDVITAEQGVGGVKDNDNVEEEPQIEMSHVTDRPQPVSLLRKLHSNLFKRKK
ncbi:antigen WC1.1-like isoform X2 [Colossoma macropomum]|uniref:antigen WC1.1-like isoform X2 n=1 Tax=Colossoma macropomum TaxID=42526 RepID=UPI001865675B|nr:antigen WC1.1-like isoform X2 [Colossoma macropomum]